MSLQARDKIDADLSKTQSDSLSCAALHTGQRFGVYIHWPYCLKICPYCDFNVYRPTNDDSESLIGAMLIDLAAQRRISGRREVSSLYLGGGSPALMTPRRAALLIDAVDSLWGLAGECEISLELSPMDCDVADLRAYRAAGVNRLSIGAQARNDSDLKVLGRFHDRAAALAVIDSGLRMFDRVSADLIYARPGQRLGAWLEELDFVASLGLEHLSLYELTIEAGTAFGRKQARGALPGPADSLELFFLATRAHAADRGYAPYETSNFARTPAAQSQHNLLYWRAQDWAAAGPGAHARLTSDDGRFALKTFDRVKKYVEAGAHGSCFESADKLTPAEAGNEALLSGLRLAEGVCRKALRTLAGRDVDPAALAELAAAGVLAATPDHIRLTEANAGLVDAVVRRLAYD